MKKIISNYFNRCFGTALIILGLEAIIANFSDCDGSWYWQLTVIAVISLSLFTALAIARKRDSAITSIGQVLSCTISMLSIYPLYAQMERSHTLFLYKNLSILYEIKPYAIYISSIILIVIGIFLIDRIE